MNSRDYWAKREDEALKHYITDEKEYDKQVKRIYQNQLDAIQTQINAFYGKYAAKENISIAEAKKRVSKLDIAEYERKAAKYVKERNFSAKANEELRLYNATMKINRLEMLKANIGLEMIASTDELDKFMEGVLRGRTEEELKRQAGILGKTIRHNAQTVHSVVNASFHNATFSDRIWMHQELLKNKLSGLLQTGLIQGKNPRVLARELKIAFKAKTSDAERLMRTELARVQTEAQKQSLQQNGFAMYEFIANRNCCDACQALDGKHFKVKDMMPGDNAAPLHPHCRCSVAPWEDSAEYEAWLDYLSKGGTTEQWEEYKKTVKEKHLTNNPTNGTMKETKLANTKKRGDLPPAMDETKYRKMVESLKAHGVTTVAAQGDDLRYLENIGAEASIMGTTHILHMGNVPSASAMFEEIIHNAQAKKYGELSDSDSTELYIREILANRLLLRNSEAYGFTERDREDVKRNLSIWEKRYKERTGIDFDESGIDRKI